MYFFYFGNSELTQRVYPLAPKAARKARILSGVSAFVVAMIALAFVLPLGLKFVEVLRGDSELNMFTCLWFALMVVFFAGFWKLSRWAWRRLDAQAQKEAEENSHLPPQAMELKTQSIARQRKRFEGWVILAVALIFAALLGSRLNFKAVDIHTISGDALKYDVIYYVDELYVLDSYASRSDKDGSNETIYYLAMFTDKDGKNWLISFRPDKDSEIEARVEEYMNNNSVPGSLKLPVYVRTEVIPSTTITNLWGNTLSGYYEEACRMYSSLGDYVPRMSTYSCDVEGSVLMYELSHSGAVIFLLVFGALALSGVYKIVKYRE